MPGACDVIVAGHLCLDIIPVITNAGFSFTPGRTVEIGPAVFSTGGAVSNTGLALHKLGIVTHLSGKVGEDSFGQHILNFISRHDPALASGLRIATGEASSFSIILNPPDADRMFLHCPGTNNTFGMEDIDYPSLREARLFHLGYPPTLRHLAENNGAELIDMLRRAKETGITTSVDMSMPDPNSFTGRVDWPQILKAALPYVDIYLPSIDETLFAHYPEQFQEMALYGEGYITPGLLTSISEDLLSMGPSIIGLKLGPRGMYLRTGGEASWEKFGRACPGDLLSWKCRELWSPCFQTTVVGTTGAGDAAFAGFLAALLRDCSPEDCTTMACAVGGCSVEAPDALGGLRSWKETRSRLAAGWQRNKLDIDLPGWREEADSGLWFGPGDKTSRSRPRVPETENGRC